MTEYLTPGVYVEEVPAQSKPIEGVATSVAAFVGLAPAGPLNTPVRIANWTQFDRTFSDPDGLHGPFMEGAYLAHSVYGYFANGGGLCWVVRVATEGKGLETPRAALPASTEGSIETLRAVARQGVEGDISLELIEESAPEQQQEGEGGGEDQGGGDGADGRRAAESTYKVVIRHDGQEKVI